MHVTWLQPYMMRDMLVDSNDIHDNDVNPNSKPNPVPKPETITGTEASIPSYNDNNLTSSNDRSNSDEHEDADDKIIKIIEKSDIERTRYLVEWSNHKQSWVEEEDMDCPELLVEFTKNNPPKEKEPHHMLKILLEALQGIQKLIMSPKALSIATIK